MKSSEPRHSGLFNTSKGKEAIAAIAEHARKCQTESHPELGQDRLLSWESTMEFGEFRITVRCDYECDYAMAVV